MSEPIPPEKMRQYLWSFYKLVFPGANGELTEEMEFPEGLVIDALKRLEYEMAQKRIAIFYLEDMEKTFNTYRHSHFHWERPVEETSKEELE